MAQPTTTLINLQSLFDLSATLNSSDDSDYILNASLLSLMGKLRTNRSCALLPDGDGLWKTAVVKGKPGISSTLTLTQEEFFRLETVPGGNEYFGTSDYMLWLPLSYAGRPLALDRKSVV